MILLYCPLSFAQIEKNNWSYTSLTNNKGKLMFLASTQSSLKSKDFLTLQLAHADGENDLVQFYSINQKLTCTPNCHIKASFDGKETLYPIINDTSNSDWLMIKGKNDFIEKFLNAQKNVTITLEGLTTPTHSQNYSFDPSTFDSSYKLLYFNVAPLN